MNEPNTVLLLFIFILSIFLGLELIVKVPSTLHTPLMSATNAISGITLIGALSILTEPDISTETFWLSFFAVIFSAINVCGGYLITNRMLLLFKSTDKKDSATP